MFLYNSTLVVKTRKPKDKQLCIAVHTYKNIHDIDPRDIQDNKKNNQKQALPYITWGLIQDVNDKRRDPSG